MSPDDGGLIGNQKIVNGRTFVQWKREVNRAIGKICGLSADDLADSDYWSMWADETDPTEAARQVLEENDFPFED